MIRAALDRFLCRRLPPARPPDRLIGGSDDPYMLRWFIIPRNPVFNVYVHLYLRSDDDRALHDHPWWSVSYMIAGPLGEWIRRPRAAHIARYRTISPGQWVWRSARFAHRLVLLETIDPRDVCGARRAGPMTLFITGPKIRAWGFWCPQGWRHWREFTAGARGESIGKGCD